MLKCMYANRLLTLNVCTYYSNLKLLYPNPMFNKILPREIVTYVIHMIDSKDFLQSYMSKCSMC